MPYSPALFAAIAVLACSLATQADEVAPADPFWTLVHDQAVLEDLKLTASQRAEWRAVLDPIDLACFKLQNKAPSEARPALMKHLADAKAQLGKLLKPLQTICSGIGAASGAGGRSTVLILRFNTSEKLQATFLAESGEVRCSTAC